jgi:teichuronic acid biosynthesis glycosyltransferase TuaG
MNLVTVITPSYNSEQFIIDTIKSVRGQTLENWQMIIVDDCSMDKTVAFATNYANIDPRIKIISLDSNMGAAYARNEALKQAKSRFIAFLDSDDQWEPNKLQVQIDFMKSQKIPISFTSYYLIDETGDKLNGVINSVTSIDYKGYLKNTIIGMSTSMIDTSLVDEFRFENIRTRQDTFLWITLLKRGHMAYGINSVLASYRVRKDSISSNKIKAVMRVWYLYYSLERLGLFKSLYYFIWYIYNALKKRV